MTQSSSILPGTTHVWLTVEHYLNSTTEIDSWLAYGRPSGLRVDMLAWQADDYLDHFHIRAYGVVHYPYVAGFVAPDNNALEAWKDMIEDNGSDPALILLAFENEADALLFKLTFGGA